jgi:Tfp pilus assembly protein PilN
MRLGIELDVGVIRAVRLPHGRGPVQVMEVAWDPERPEDAVQVLHETLGRATYLSVAVAMPLLLVKRVKLPPVPARDRAAIVQLEPQRFFAVRLEELVAAVRDEDDLVFAAREASLTQWLTALQALGPVYRVEPSPLALARALEEGKVTDTVVLLDGAATGAGVGLVEIRSGRVTQARRLYGQLSDAAMALSNADASPSAVMVEPWDENRARTLAERLPTATAAPLPAVSDVPSQFLPAYGAARGVDRSLAYTLMPEHLRNGIRRRRQRDLVLAGMAAVVALVFAVTSVLAWKDRSVRAIEGEIQAVKGMAAEAMALQTQFETMNRQANAIASVRADRAAPLSVLLALSKRLPPGAYLRSLRASGEEWQIEGHAGQAAQLIQVLGAAPEFRGVRFLSATNRIQVDERSYETFSLAFRFVPAP